MILDHLRFWKRYASLQPRIQAALDYLQGSDFARLDDGRYHLDGESIVAIVSRYQTKALADAVWESHRRYIDVQYVAEGHERFGYVPLDRGGAITTPYNADRDVVFYEPAEDTLRLTAGHFAIFYPEDIHAPGLATDLKTPSDVLKVVVKVAV